MKEVIRYHPRVSRALDDGAPVVALESTVITHGLPWPHNLETAVAMESAVREGGATPATVAIIQGIIFVGLTTEQLTYLAKQPMAAVRKCSRKDLPVALAKGEDGATTVAGTMIVAHMSGIELFATGGIGGVHRDHPYDVSADLTELGQTPVSVVCSGAKSILDLRRTRELLETNGVTIIGYETDELPAFFSRRSGFNVDVRLDTPEEIAAMIRYRRDLHLKSGLLVTVPVPVMDEFDSEEAETAIAQATHEADEAGISGSMATPWLLKRVNELTGGRSMKANVSLLQNNARLAGLIAAAL